MIGKEDGQGAYVRAFARHLKRTAPGGRLLIGYASAPALWAAAAAEGVEALVAERPVPLPVLAVAVLAQGAAGGLYLTEDGLQPLMADGGPVPAETAEAIQAEAEALADPPETPAPTGAASSPPFDPAPTGAAGPPLFDPAPAYWARLERLVDLPALQRFGPSVAVDAMHGTGADYLARLGPALMLRQTHNLDGTPPEPDEESLAQLITAVQRTGAALGLATSGDGGRFGCIDPRWGYLTGNQALSLILWYLTEVKGQRGLVVRSVATTHLLDRIALRRGCGVLETPTGFSYLARAMRTQDVLLAGEESGALALGGHVPIPDGILACLLLAQIRAETETPLCDLLIKLFDTYGPTITRRVDVPLAPGARHRIAERLAREEFPDKFGGRWVISMDRKDGFKFLLGNHTWALVRFGDTDQVAHVYGEAQHPVELERVLADLVADLGRP